MRRCPAPGCGKPIPPLLFACREHWFALPADVRGEINAAWAVRLKRPLSIDARARHEAAKAAAEPYWKAS